MLAMHVLQEKEKFKKKKIRFQDGYQKREETNGKCWE
jgi:hypothetical protein